MVEKISVMEARWDYLVILDACRYDYFSILHPNYIRGRLDKVISPGSHTLEWCKKSFQGVYDDVIYISANPYINSKGEVKGFKAADHFYEIIDVWDWGWDEGFGTVHPKKVNEAVYKIKDCYPSKRLIIHYLQPHAPYLGDELQTFGFPKPKIGRGHPLGGIKTGRNHKFLEKSLVKLLGTLIKPATYVQRLSGTNLLWKICETLDLPPVSPMDVIRRKFGNEGLRRAYVQNLKIVLEHVARLVESLSGAVVITADHGEYLGEGGRYSHSYGHRAPLLLEVPWLVIEKVGYFKEKKANDLCTYREYETQGKERVRERLRKLGYL